MKELLLKLAARIAGAELMTIEGRDPAGKWHLGRIIVTPGGMNAFRASFRTGATTRTDMALTDRNPEDFK